MLRVSFEGKTAAVVVEGCPIWCGWPTCASRVKIPKPNHVEYALEAAGFKVLGHPITMWPYVLIEGVLNPGSDCSVKGTVAERAALALKHWQRQGVSWTEDGKRLVVFIPQERKGGRPVGANLETEIQAAREFELHKAGRSYQAIRDELYPQTAIEIDAIKQRVRRYAKRHGKSPK